MPQPFALRGIAASSGPGLQIVAVTYKSFVAPRMDSSHDSSTMRKFPEDRDRAKLTGKDRICLVGILAPISAIEEDGFSELETVRIREEASSS
mmetsp:Transcript_7818/g.18845  ORF Transcript_7818/g.18845 Transcript_7818/m.18845 type:complete len:93 (+) Transcript_7818:507-785(+)